MLLSRHTHAAQPLPSRACTLTGVTSPRQSKQTNKHTKKYNSGKTRRTRWWWDHITKPYMRDWTTTYKIGLNKMLLQTDKQALIASNGDVTHVSLGFSSSGPESWRECGRHGRQIPHDSHTGKCLHPGPRAAATVWSEQHGTELL